MLFILRQTSARPNTLLNECPSVLFPSPYLRLTSRPPSCTFTFFLSHSIFPLRSRGPFSLIRSLRGGRESLHKPVVSLIILRLQSRMRSDAQMQVHKGRHIRTSATLLHRLVVCVAPQQKKPLHLKPISADEHMRCLAISTDTTFFVYLLPLTQGSLGAFTPQVVKQYFD